MATIIDSLLVTLGLDAAGMIKGARDTTDALKSIEEESKRASDQFQKQQDSDADAFKKRQRKEADEFNRKKQKQLEEGKLSKQQGLEETILFKRRQTDEASVFRKSQQQKQKDFKQGWIDRMKSAKDEQASNKKQQEAMSALRGEFLGIAAIIGGLNMLKDLSALDTHVNRTAQSLGVSTRELNNWQMAAERTGVSAEEMAGAFRISNQFQSDLATGSEDAIKKLNEFASTVQGLSSISGKPIQANWNKFADKNLSAQERLIEVSKILSQLSNKDAALAAAKLGYAEDTARFLHQGADAIEAQKKAAEDLDPFMQEAAEKSTVLNSKWTEFKQAIKGAGNDILRDISGPLGAVLDVVTNIIKSITDFDAGRLNETNTAQPGEMQYDAMGNPTGYATPDEESSAPKVPAVAPAVAAPASPPAAQTAPASSAPSASGSDVKQAVADTAKTAGAAALPYDLTKNVPPEIVSAALKSQNKYGVPASVTIAQWILESSSGKKMPQGSNNPFGIKAKAGQPFVEAMTDEVINGVKVRLPQKFAKFDSIDDAFEQHAKLLASHPAYKEARKHEDNADEFADALTNHYATDPLYGAKLKNIMHGTNATGAPRAGASMAANSGATTNQSNSTTSVQTTIGNVTVNAPNAKTNADVATAIKDKFSTYTYAANANVGMQ